MKEFLFELKSIAKGKSITRSILDYHLRTHTFLKGNILDLGAGKRDLYSNFIPKESSSIYNLLDLKQGNQVDFETDALPYDEHVFDTVLLLNVLEHVFNYNNLLSEVRRIKKPEGELIGFVPFLMWYHPDHHDYFRYTHEALQKILDSLGYKEISIITIYKGPFTAALQMTYPVFPRLFRAFLFIGTSVLDSIFLYLRRKNAERYVLGYYFTSK